jgi:hypothetical protein
MIGLSTEPAGTNLERPTGEIYSSPSAPPDIDPQSIAPESPVEPERPSIATPTDDVLAPGPKPLDKQHFDVLVERVTTAGTEITTAMGGGLSESERLREAVAEWCTLHGLDTPDEEQSRTIVARQAALSLLLKTALYEWRHQMVGDVLVEHVQDETIEASRPAVFQRANELLATITHGRYELVLAEGKQTFRAYNTAKQKGFALDELSSGTRVQVLLAVRLAFVEQQEQGARLPIVLDETLANTDDLRAEVIIRSLIELAKEGRQIF